MGRKTENLTRGLIPSGENPHHCLCLPLSPTHISRAHQAGATQVEEMGLLTVGKPYNWERAGEHREYVRRHGVLQFLSAYIRVKDIHNDELLWGDEVRRERGRP